MSRFFLKSFFLFSTFLVIYSCSSSKKAQVDTIDEDSLKREQTIVPDTFVFPDVPDEITKAEARAEYLVMHYWDRFDFADEKLTLRPEITEQAFVDYINILSLVPFDKAKESLILTLKKAGADNVMYSYFGTLSDKYFYGSNSPFRNEEFYIPVLQELVNSNFISEADKSRYRFQLEMVMKNRVGQTANDFSYTLASGQTKKMYSIRSEYLVLMFSNPGCSTCASVTNALAKSPTLNEAFSMNSPTRTMITVLTVYPDEDINEWRSHLPQMPANWIHSYDKGTVITKQKLYDIRAIPTLYLLDKDKKVILKDTSIEAVESFFAKPNE
ncbi:MAG TPA: DUF5106 domain-containing protein [Petrimonas sp.]|uniref:DUF5106 domain-containing protein n=1 Tax=Petrimonas sp. TaxID=2023866 RepID=UPI001772B9EA|nr:DUF5106 domain-containing protein [Petrimonas sp.]MEA4949937.1 DUF5106 domain-containing protein [Petrimonas sp.]MEA4979951.1 DUF5106 domain-containing protein [Petrimonas sp.]MEA5063424.1 DUF5106 domain-containing protein [Petrimonas sp.]HHV84237.1 DUF5106 domain-containing protein [Petrimonas sp.]